MENNIASTKSIKKEKTSYKIEQSDKKKKESAHIESEEIQITGEYTLR